jgi:hypothetical protein
VRLSAASYPPQSGSFQMCDATGPRGKAQQRTRDRAHRSSAPASLHPTSACQALTLPEGTHRLLTPRKRQTRRSP